MRNTAILLIVCVFSIFFPTDTQSQDFPKADALPFIGIEGYSEQLEKAVFAVQIEGNQDNEDLSDDWIPLGTGFLVKGKKFLLGITCYHIIEEIIKRNKKIYVGLDTDKGYLRFQADTLLNVPNNDVSILIFKGRKDVDKLQTIMIGMSMLCSSDSTINEGRGVIIVGYPLSLGVSYDKNHPVTRFGIVAQYTGGNTILIDGFASHGNSGSPVLCLKHKQVQIIGMIISHIADNITLYDENKRLVARLPYNSGLAQAVSGPVLFEILEKLNN